MTRDSATQTSSLLPPPEQLRLTLYPDPLLRRKAAAVTEFDADTSPRLEAVGRRMLAMMREHKGVGLAGPQAGVGVRMFVMNATSEPADDRIYVNPTLTDLEGDDEDEEGCLSLPDVRTPVLRAASARLDAFTPDGTPVTEHASGFVARVWQHELDHLDGILITDKMPPTARMAARRTLRDLEEQFALKAARRG